MSQNVEKREERKPLVVLYNQGETEMTFLVKAFFISADKGGARVTLQPEGFGGQNVYIVPAMNESMTPQDSGLTMGEKILMRFEAAMDGRSRRVDLRFCTGADAVRDPRWDNLHPDYGR